MGNRTDRTGVIVVRVWVEDGTPARLRARITETLDAAGSQTQVTAAGSPDDVYAAVQHWLETFLQATGRR